MIKKPARRNNCLIEFFLIITAIITLLLFSVNVESYLKNHFSPKKAVNNTDILGVNKDLLQERLFWKNFLNNQPDYYPGWLELAKIEKELGNNVNYLKAIEAAHKLNPNSKELKSLMFGD